MAAKSDDVPPVPVPPPGSGVPPVEPPPAATPPAPAAAPAPTAAPVEPNPYAAPTPGYPPHAQPDAAPYGQAPYGQPGYSPQPAGPAQGLSIVSMVLGMAGLLFSLFGFGLLPAIAAVITGHMAQQRQPHAKPFWLTGIITGYVGLAISLIAGLFFLLAIFAVLGSASYFG